MLLFDSFVQELKYKVLKEVAKCAWNDSLSQEYLDIPQKIVPGKTPTMRCCIYKERAILTERVKLAMGGSKDNPNVIEVIDIACDDCPAGGYEVTDACRGCIAKRCLNTCKKGAITIDKFQKAHIDKSKCVECGLCSKACPYHAIVNHKRPCELACKVKAISMNEDKSAKIDHSKCISCGSCVYQCPFGAISGKSFILDAISLIKNSNKNANYKVYALVAPSISSQFKYAKIGQLVSGIKQLGFYDVVEVALGADMVALSEAKELYEKGFLTSSCCPAFVDYIKKQFPALTDKISHNLSPMAMLGKYIKEKDSNAKIVFIGSCIAKKMERQKEEVAPYVDCVLTFKELQALLDSKDIDITKLEETKLENASFYGRIFARSGGLTAAITQAIKEQNLDLSKFKPISCDGIEQCKLALLKASKNALDANFIEGMACVQGCIGGPGCLTHEEKNKMEVDNFGKETSKTSIIDATTSCDL